MKKPKDKFTAAEQAAIDLYIETELEEGKEAIKAIAEHGRHDAKGLKELEKHQRKIERDEIPGITEPIFRNTTRLNRAWTPENLQDIWDGLRCPLDLSLHADRFGGDE